MNACVIYVRLLLPKHQRAGRLFGSLFELFGGAAAEQDYVYVCHVMCLGGQLLSKTMCMYAM